MASMNTLKIIVVNILMLTIQAFAQYAPDFVDDKIIGKVKSIKETGYELNDRFGKMVKGKFQGYTIKNYNDRGDLTEQNKYGADNKLQYKIKCTYKYDTQGNKIEHDFYSKDGKLSTIYKLKFNDKKQNIESSSYSADGRFCAKIINKFDNRGNVVEECSYSSNGKIIQKNIYRFDEHNNLKEVNNFDMNGQLTSRDTYTYDNHNNKTNHTSKLTDGNVNSSNNFSYKYDSFGRKIEERCKEFNSINKYEYDKKNNWVKLEHYDYENGYPIYVEERKIEYAKND